MFSEHHHTQQCCGLQLLILILYQSGCDTIQDVMQLWHQNLGGAGWKQLKCKYEEKKKLKLTI